MNGKPYRLPIPWTLFALAALALLMIPAGCATSPGYGQVSIQDRNTRVDVAFSNQDRAMITDYYRKSLPPGLAKKGKVPPGHQKKLAKHGTLPPGQGWEALPPSLEGRLSRLPDGYVRIRVGADIGIMNVKTRVVFDVINDL